MVGKPGSGKTLVSLQCYILPALLSGRSVFHNIPGLDSVKIAHHLRGRHNRRDITPYYVESLLSDYSNEYLMQNWRDIFPAKKTVPPARRSPPSEDDLGLWYLNSIPKAPQGSLVVLDEAQKKCYINSKNWREERNRKFFEYCSVHRKSRHEVLIITQDDDNIDGSVNGIREELIFLLRQERLGFKNRVRLRYYLGHQNIRNTPYATSGVGYDKAVFGLYESYAPSLSGAAGRKEVRRFRFVLLSPKLIVVSVLGFLLFAWNLPATLRLFQGRMVPDRSSSSAASSSSFSLGEYEEYYCGDMFYVLRPGGKVDTLEPKGLPPSYCPRYNYNFRRSDK